MKVIYGNEDKYSNRIVEIPAMNILKNKMEVEFFLGI